MKDIISLDGHKIPYVYSQPKNGSVGNIILAQLKSKSMGFLYLGDFKIGNDLVNKMLAFQLGDFIPKINIPVLIFHGDRDEIVPLRFTEEYYHRFNSCELRILKGSGHGFLDNQTEVIKETCSWVVSSIKLTKV